MKYIKFFEELNAEYKSDMEIIYRDNNLVCLMPKTYRGSAIYSCKTRWCSKELSGYNMAVKNNSLLFRFLFKNGAKLRLTVHGTNSWDWGTVNADHIFVVYSHERNNPFDLSVPKNDIERNNYDLIKSIPNECIDKVLDIINEHALKNGKGEYALKYANDEDNYKSLPVKNFISKYINELNDLQKLFVDTNVTLSIGNRNFKMKLDDKLIVTRNFDEFKQIVLKKYDQLKEFINIRNQIKNGLIKQLGDKVNISVGYIEQECSTFYIYYNHEMKIYFFPNENKWAIITWDDVGTDYGLWNDPEYAKEIDVNNLEQYIIDYYKKKVQE